MEVLLVSEVRNTKRRKVLHIVIGSISMVLVFVLCAIVNCKYDIERETNHQWRCGPLPEGLNEIDLIGTWRARLLGEVTDTITLRKDHQDQLRLIIGGFESPKRGQ